MSQFQHTFFMKSPLFCVVFFFAGRKPLISRLQTIFVKTYQHEKGQKVRHCQNVFLSV